MSEAKKETGLDLVEKEINSALSKENITEAIISKFKVDYLSLKVASLDDKETYKKIVEGRKEVKRVRLIGSAIFKKGREEYENIVKKWKDKEKEVEGEFKAIESELQIEQDKYEEWQEAEKQRAAEERRLFIQGRLDQLIMYGASDIQFQDVENLSELAFDMRLEQYKTAYQDKIKAQELSSERINLLTSMGITIDTEIDFGTLPELEFDLYVKKTKAELYRQKEEQELIKKELEEAREASERLKIEQEAEALKLKIEAEKIEFEKKAFYEARLKMRIAQVEKELKCKVSLNAEYTAFKINVLKTKTEDEVEIAIPAIYSISDEEFNNVIKNTKVRIAEVIKRKKEEKEQEVNYQKEQEIEASNVLIDNNVFSILLDTKVKPALEAVSGITTLSKAGEEALEEVHTLIGKAVLILENFNNGNK